MRRSHTLAEDVIMPDRTLPMTHATGAPVVDNTNIKTAGPRGLPRAARGYLANREAGAFRSRGDPGASYGTRKRWAAHGTFTVTHDITRYTKAKIFSEIGKQTPMFARFSTASGERGAADAERNIRGFEVKFYSEEGNWDITGNNTPVFFHREPLRFPDLNHAIRRDPRSGLPSDDNKWDFWTLVPDALHQVTITMSDRGIPKNFRHMHGYGSHTFSMINAASERVLGQIPFPDATGNSEPHRCRGRSSNCQGPRQPRPRPFRCDRGGRFPTLDALHSGHDGRTGQGLPLQSLRPDEGLAQGRVSIDGGRRDGAQPQSRELFR